MTMSELTTLLGWTAVINIVVLSITFVMITAMKLFAMSIHQALFDVTEQELQLLYLRFLASYKMLNLCLLRPGWRYKLWAID